MICRDNSVKRSTVVATGNPSQWYNGNMNDMFRYYKHMIGEWPPEHSKNYITETYTIGTKSICAPSFAKITWCMKLKLYPNKLNSFSWENMNFSQILNSLISRFPTKARWSNDFEELYHECLHNSNNIHPISLSVIWSPVVV